MQIAADPNVNQPDSRAQFGDALLDRVRRHLLLSPSSVSHHEVLMMSVRPVTDARRGALVGEDGVFSCSAIPAGTVLTEYGGLVTPMSQHLLRSRQGLRRPRDEKTLLLASTLFWSDEPLFGIIEEEGIPDRLVIDGSFHSNIGAKFNDFRLAPLLGRRAAADIGRAQPDPPPNATFVELVIAGWPRTFIVAERDIPPGAEITIDYGVAFWESIRLQNAFDASPAFADGSGKVSVARLVDLLARL